MAPKSRKRPSAAMKRPSGMIKRPSSTEQIRMIKRPSSTEQIAEVEDAEWWQGRVQRKLSVPGGGGP